MTEPAPQQNPATQVQKPKIRLNAMLSNRERATTVTIGFALAAIILLFYLVTLLNFCGQLEEYNRVGGDIFALQSSAETVDGIYMVYLFMILLNAIFFISWFYRAYWNLENCGWPRLTQFGSGWAIGSWFVPFLNLVRPVRMAYEIGEGMQKVAFVRRKEDLPLMQSLPIIGAWWGLYLAHNICMRIGASMVENSRTPGDVISGFYFLSFAVGLGIVALLCCYFMVRKISGFEAQAFARHNEEAANQDNPFVDEAPEAPGSDVPAAAPAADDPFA